MYFHEEHPNAGLIQFLTNRQRISWINFIKIHLCYKLSQLVSLSVAIADFISTYKLFYSKGKKKIHQCECDLKTTTRVLGVVSNQYYKIIWNGKKDRQNKAFSSDTVLKSKCLFYLFIYLF